MVLALAGDSTITRCLPALLARAPVARGLAGARAFRGLAVVAGDLAMITCGVSVSRSAELKISGDSPCHSLVNKTRSDALRQRDGTSRSGQGQFSPSDDLAAPNSAGHR